MSDDPETPPSQPAFDSLDKALKHLQIAEAWLIESIRHLHPSLGSNRQVDERYREASNGIANTRAQIRMIKMAQLSTMPDHQAAERNSLANGAALPAPKP
jgi:hypothetical protein